MAALQESRRLGEAGDVCEEPYLLALRSVPVARDTTANANSHLEQDFHQAKANAAKICALPRDGCKHLKEGFQEVLKGVHDEHRPVCNKCQRAWRWPRNLSHVHLDVSIPKHIKPTTQSTVVAYLSAQASNDGEPPKPSIPEDVFRNLEFSWTPPSRCSKIPFRLVDEFEYDSKTGEVYYDVGENAVTQDNIQYARLVTLNSWYNDLFDCFTRVILSVIDYYCNAALLFSLFYPRGEVQLDVQEAVGEFPRYCFAGSWTVMLCIQVVWSITAASKEWEFKSSYKVGDIMEMCSKRDLCKSFVALVFFTFFPVERSVRDVVINLHPWKSVQPFAAFKSDGSRAFVVGHRSKEMFHVGDWRGHYFRLLTQQSLNTIAFVLKVFICIRGTQVSLIFSCLTSFPAIFLGWKVWFGLRRDRRVLRQKLTVDIIRGSEDGLREQGRVFGELERRQHEASLKLYESHFGTCQLKNVKKTVGGSTGKKKPLCERCGRDEPTGMAPRKSRTADLDICEGQRVRLSENSATAHDARFGPLKKGDIGRILQVGIFIQNMGRRYRVALEAETQGAFPEGRPCESGCGFQATWPDTHCCSQCSESRGVHGTQCQRRATGTLLAAKGASWWYDAAALAIVDGPLTHELDDLAVIDLHPPLPDLQALVPGSLEEVQGLGAAPDRPPSAS